MRHNGGLAQFAEALIEYIEDLITASSKETFTKVEILVLLNVIKNDPVMMHMLNSCDQPSERTESA